MGVFLRSSHTNYVRALGVCGEANEHDLTAIAIDRKLHVRVCVCVCVRACWQARATPARKARYVRYPTTQLMSRITVKP